MIVPKSHRESVFNLTKEERDATYHLLHRVKAYLDENNAPEGYNLGWNCGEVGGQHIFHAHFHVISWYADEPLAGKRISHHFKGSGNARKG